MALKSCDITNTSSHAGTSRIGVLRPAELHRLIGDKQKKVIIIDTRPVRCHEKMHIRDSICIAHDSRIVWSLLMHPSTTVEDVLSDSGRAIFKARSPDSIIVVHDYDSFKWTDDNDSILYYIIEKLSDTEDSVFFLRGGISDVSRYFPELVIWSTINAPEHRRSHHVIPEQPSLSQPNLFLGNRQDAADTALINARRIKWIANVLLCCLPKSSVVAAL